MKSVCIVCGIHFSKQKGKRFCTPQCQNNLQHAKYIKEWQEGNISGGNIWGVSAYVRRFLLKKAGNCCSKCGWCKENPFTGKVFLEINHIDGNWDNNVEANLEVLCLNCHSLTPNYRSLNNGKGRHSVFKQQGKVVYTKPKIK